MIATLSAAFTWGRESILWRLGPNPREGMEFDHPDGRIVMVTMPEFSSWVAAADAIERASIGDSFYLALFTGQRQTDRLIMRNESGVDGRHAFRQSKTGELVDIKEAPQLSARLNASRARIKTLRLRLQLETVPLELVVNEDNGEPYDESTYRHWVSAARAVAVFGFLARDTVRQAIVRAERLTAELTRTVDRLFAPFPLDEEKRAQRARAVDKRARALAQWLDEQAARDSNGDKGGMAPEAVPVADVRQWRRRARPETRSGPARYLRHAARSRRLRSADNLRHHGALVPKRADHREAPPRRQRRSRRCWHRPTRIAGAQGRDEGLIADRSAESYFGGGL